MQIYLKSETITNLQADLQCTCRTYSHVYARCNMQVYSLPDMHTDMRMDMPINGHSHVGRYVISNVGLRC
jgi:hypothetical protein